MEKREFVILENAPLTEQVYRLRLGGDADALRTPGQFVSILLPGFYLRRPFSVCDWGAGELTVIYKRLGRGTRAMTDLPAGTSLDVLIPLGNGFSPEESGPRPLLAGGGVGIPPLYGLARRLRQAGREVTAVLGFNTAGEIFLRREFEALGVETVLCTADGSAGERGLVSDAVAARSAHSHLFACGPEPMLRAVYAVWDKDAQFSFEERMGCGFGACMGCTCATVSGPRRICREGPVLRREEILW